MAKRDHRIFNERHAKRNNAHGITLIELGFIVGIIAVIVVGVLTIYNTVTKQQAVTDVTGDAASIRTAVATWGSGGWLKLPEGFVPPATSEGIERELTSWKQLSAHLPGDLGRIASTADGAILTNVNSNWEDAEYGLKVDDPYLWTLQITGIPDEQDAQVLAMRLEEGSVKTVVSGKTVSAQYTL